MILSDGNITVEAETEQLARRSLIQAQIYRFYQADEAGQIVPPAEEVLRVWAEAQINEWANSQVMALKILEPELFYIAMVSNIAFRLLEWNTLGKPEAVDPARFIVTHSEAQAYAETSLPGMTAAELLRLQEQKWLQMQQGFAAIVYKRRVALERVKLAEVGDGLEAALAEILVELTK